MNDQESTGEAGAPTAKAAPPARRRPRGLVTLWGTWCKGCGICSAFCPQGVLEANGQGRPRVAHPELCTACHWCDTHCPDMAISVRRLDPEEVEELEMLAGQGAPGGEP